MKIQLTPAGIYVSCLERQPYICTTGEAAFRLFARVLEFSRFSDGSKLHSSPQCTSLFPLSDGTKIGIIFQSSKKMHKKISEAAGFGDVEVHLNVMNVENYSLSKSFTEYILLNASKEKYWSSMII